MSGHESVERTYLGGLPFLNVDAATTCDMLLTDAVARRPRVYVLVNAYSATLRRRDPAYARLLFETAVVPLPDGASLSMGARLLGRRNTKRCPGPDLLETCAKLSGGDQPSHYLLGGDPGVAEKLRDALVSKYPTLQVAGVATPPFGTWSDNESRALVAMIETSGAGILWLGVSAPKQETWAVRWREEIGRPIVCVGAAFDFLSGQKRRAPVWMRRAGLEWFYRLVSEPRRLWKRYLVGNAVFVFDLLRSRGDIPGKGATS